MIKLIIFDFGGVLGSDADDWDFDFKKSFAKYWPQLKVGTITLSYFWDEMLQDYFSSIKVNTELLTYIKTLRKRGFKLVLLANESKEGMTNKINRFKLDKYFDKIYCSAFLGIAKPDPKTFEIVLEEFGVKPSEVIFIDNQKPNTEVAKRLGIKTILC